MKTNIHFWSYLVQFFLEWDMFQSEVVENIKTRIFCSMIFLKKHCALSEIMWKNMVDWGRPQMTVWHMHIPCWIPKATNTLRMCNTYRFSTAIMVAQMRLNVTLYVHCLSYLFFVLRCISMLYFIFHHFYFLYGTVAFHFLSS